MEETTTPEPRKALITIRVTKGELERYRNAATYHGCSVADICREALELAAANAQPFGNQTNEEIIREARERG